MIRLARNYPEPATISSVCADEDIAQKSLGLILFNLKTGCFVDSLWGAQDGYLLRRPPQKIFLGEIIRAIDGAPAPIADDNSWKRNNFAPSVRTSVCLATSTWLRSTGSRIMMPSSTSNSAGERGGSTFSAMSRSLTYRR